MIQSIAKRKGQLSTRCVMGFSRGLILLSTALVVVFTTLFFRTFVDLAQAKAKRTFSQGEKPQAGWLYVVDSRNGSKEAQILLIAPAEGRIVKTFKTGMNPDIAVSPDGSKLYIAFTDLDQSGGRRELLAVVDTTSGALLRTVNNPNRVFYNIVPPSSSMALSHNGRWLYVMKYKPIATFNTLYWIEAFDTKLGNFLPEKATLSSCGWARPLPARMDEQVQVACEESKDVRLLKLNASGPALASTVQFPSKTGAQSAGTRDETRADFIAKSFSSGDDRNIIVTRDGRILELNLTAKSARQIASVKVPLDQWVHDVTRTAGGDKLFVSLTLPPTLNQGHWAGGEILSVDSLNSAQLGLIKTSEPFNYLFLSADGSRIYTINTFEASITVIDAPTLSEMSIIRGVGVSPSLVVEAP